VLIHTQGEPNGRGSYTFLAENLQTCVTYTIGGALKYPSSRTVTGTGDILWRLQDVRLADLSTRVVATKYDPGAHACTTRPHRWQGATATQRWAGHKCDFDPRIIVSFPAAISVSFWPSCSDKDAAILKATEGPASSLFKGWDDVKVKFEDQQELTPGGASPPKMKCYGVVMRFDMDNGGEERTFKSPKRHKVCPHPNW
jgi:hypothetical protein